jgi:ankyrin repeat protein
MSNQQDEFLLYVQSNFHRHNTSCYIPFHLSILFDCAHFGINQLLLSPLKCAICSGITVRFEADFASRCGWGLMLSLATLGPIYSVVYTVVAINPEGNLAKITASDPDIPKGV